MRARARLREGAATGLRRCGRVFLASTHGIAAVEFALILPVMIVIYFGMVAIAAGVNTDRKLTLVARTVSDLTGRVPTMNDTELNNIAGAAAAVLAPYDPAGMEISVASVVVRSTGGGGSQNLEARICWSQTRKINSSGQPQKATPPSDFARGALITPIPEGFATADSSFVLTRVNHEYKPVIGETLFKYATGHPDGSISLGETTPWAVRNVREVVYQGTPACLGAT